MNYLGHLFLSSPDEDALLGSLLGDFVKGPIPDHYSSSVARAIALHRRLDTFTDQHPLFRRSKARVSSTRRRYAGIMIDMFYDHFLARYWSEFHDDPLAQFSARVYEILGRRQAELPPRLQAMIPYIAQGDWFGSYAHWNSIDAALNRISRRLTRGTPLIDAAAELQEHYIELEADFRAFLPVAQAFVNSDMQ
jgi:acyl carrier protein phosphodiesterase